MTVQSGQIHHQRYRFDRSLGQGAFGTTWQGWHLLLYRPVAIKVIDASRLDELSQERVMRECRIGGQLTGVHIVNVFDAYREGTDLCIVMELMAGGSLKEYLAKQRPTLAQGLRWGLDLAKALTAVHQKGIIHRDIKPGNILLTENGQVKIADFGIAHLPGSQLTVFQPGTPSYHAPEQEKNQPVDPTTDVYGLSAVLFELFIGEPFFRFKQLKEETPVEWREEILYRLTQNYPDTPESTLVNLLNALSNGLAPDRSSRSLVPIFQQALVTILASLAEEARDSSQVQSLEIQSPLRPEKSGDQITDTKTSLARIGRFELQAQIGRGGMGTVYKAYDPRLERLVALKAVTLINPDQRARFQQEARVAGRLHHPHIVTVYDVGEEGHLAYIVMELVEGQTLANLLPARHAWPEAIKLLLPICQALDHAHRHGVIHRDVKPANVLLTAEGQIKLTDFGIAHLTLAPKLTKTGAVLGTPLYMAPEQLAGEAIDGRTDIFALGVMLFELVAGQNPFVGDKATQGWGRLLDARSPNFAYLEELASSALEAVIRRALAEERAARFATAAQMAEALEACLHEVMVPERPAVEASVINVRVILPQVEISGSIILTAAERNLLAESFNGYDRVYVESELSSSTGDARLLVVLPVRSGRSLARVIVKLATPELLSREWKAYQEYVAEILPMVTAHIQGAPLLSPDRKLALLRYTFTGDISERKAESLAFYYQRHPGSEVAGLLTQNIFQVIAPNWWLNREADRFSLYREYDQLLPVHLVIKCIDTTETPPLLLKAGTVTVQDLRHLEVDQPVQIQGFRVGAVQIETQTLILWTLSATGNETERLRLELIGLSAAEPQYQPGDLTPNFMGRIVATRPQLLFEAAQVGFPDTDLHRPIIVLNGLELSNPLVKYEALLEQLVSGMISIIHGSLTLENILVEPESGLTWLINFAQTRQGHNLYDLLQLETQIVTRLLPLSVNGSEVGLVDEIIKMAQALHTLDWPTHAPHPVFQKPYELLRVIRHMASQCLLDANNWDEYYQGLAIMLLGTLPSVQENPAIARLIFVWAAMTCRLIGQPLAREREEKPAEKRSLPSYLWPTLSLAGITVVIAAFFTARYILVEVTPTPGISTPTPMVTLSSPTPTLSPTSTTTPTPGSVSGVLKRRLKIYDGPGENYPFFDEANRGTRVQVTGRNTSGSWWQIAHPAGPDGYGWVEAKSVQIDPEETPVLPTVIPSPPPTVTHTPTSTPIPTATPTVMVTPTATNTPPPTPTPQPTPAPPGTPTASANRSRELVNNTAGYQALANSLVGRPPTSASFSPNGTEMAVTEGAKLYTVNKEGTAGHIWLEEDETIRPVEGLVWSPDGRYIAFVADRKRDCTPCRLVGFVRLADGGLRYLEPPAGQAIGLPRWTQDGRLLVTIYPGDDLAHGTTYVYETSGQGQVASGSYVLSSSPEGQKWSPWRPGKTWQVNPTQPHSYYGD